MILISPTILDLIEAVVRAYYSRKFSERTSMSEVRSQDFKIIVPVYNSSTFIEDTLKKLWKYKDKVIVVDDCSTDDTVEKVRKMGFYVITSPDNGKKVGAILRGLCRVQTKYVVVMDSDSWIEEGDLERLVGVMEKEGLDACAVRVLPEGDGILSELQYIEYLKAMRLGRRSMDGDKPLVPCVSGAFGVFRTDLLWKVTVDQINNGMVWEGEDFERTLRIIERGGRVGYVDDFIVRTKCPTSLRDLIRQRMCWSHGYIRVHFMFRKFLKRRDKLGLTFLYNFILNIFLHPLKLIFLIFLFLDPLRVLLPFFSFYIILEYIILRYYHIGGEKYRKKYILLVPFYNLFLLFVRTLGYLRYIIVKFSR